ncbi:hypothetical protein ACLOJK_037679 [Asimina triloba]
MDSIRICPNRIWAFIATRWDDGNGWVQPLVDHDGFVHGDDRRRSLAWPRFECLLKKMEPRICMKAAAVGASGRPWRWCWGLDRADGVRTDACHVMVLCYHAVNDADWLLAADGRTCWPLGGSAAKGACCWWSRKRMLDLGRLLTSACWS